MAEPCQSGRKSKQDRVCNESAISSDKQRTISNEHGRSSSKAQRIRVSLRKQKPPGSPADLGGEEILDRIFSPNHQRKAQGSQRTSPHDAPAEIAKVSSKANLKASLTYDCSPLRDKRQMPTKNGKHRQSTVQIAGGGSPTKMR